MSSSLDSLVNNLAHGGGEFFGFEDYNESQYKLLSMMITNTEMTN